MRFRIDKNVSPEADLKGKVNNIFFHFFSDNQKHLTSSHPVDLGKPPDSNQPKFNFRNTGAILSDMTEGNRLITYPVSVI